MSEFDLAGIAPAPAPTQENSVEFVKIYHSAYQAEDMVPTSADFEALKFLGWEKVTPKTAKKGA